VEATRLHDQLVPRGGHLLRSGERGGAFFTVKSGVALAAASSGVKAANMVADDSGSGGAGQVRL